MNLLFCGDIMPGGVLPYQQGYMDSQLADFMSSFDFRIGTLEAAIGTNIAFDADKMAGRQNIIYARDEDLFRIKEMGFDVVSLANNHVWDLGVEGLENTIKMLDANGIKHCGAGMCLDEASRPAVINKEGKTIAIFAYCMVGSKYLGYVEEAKTDKAGINPLNINSVVLDIKRAKKMYDYVIVLPHWGREYHFDPLSNCVEMAKTIIKAGADAVLGSHPHQIQPTILYRGKPICFSMGNFLFPDFYMYPPRPIWYPSTTEDLSKIADTYEYPYPIDTPLRRVWKKNSRYGCVVTISCELKRLSHKNFHVCLDDRNVLRLKELDDEILAQLESEREKVMRISFRDIARRLKMKLVSIFK